MGETARTRRRLLFTKRLLPGVFYNTEDMFFKMLKVAAETTIGVVNAGVAVGGAIAATVSAPPPPGTGDCSALAGDWVPCRHDEWRNRNIGPSHKSRARAAHTRVTYDAQGRGTGRVGEHVVQYSVSQIADGKFTATAKVPLILWTATDGNLTLHRDGTLEVQYPSNGIVEYWQRAGGAQARPRLVRVLSRRSGRVAPQPSRPIRLVIRHFGPGSPLGSSKDLKWHWGLAIGDDNDCYEVAGSMCVIGPNGIVAASSMFATKTRPTHLSQYDAYLSLPQRTQKTDEDVIAFCRQWVNQHPMYHILGPNCQTFADDLFTFLCGKSLPFDKSANRIDNFGRGTGPEHHSSTQWIRPERKPS